MNDDFRRGTGHASGRSNLNPTRVRRGSVTMVRYGESAFGFGSQGFKGTVVHPRQNHRGRESGLEGGQGRGDQGRSAVISESGGSGQGSNGTSNEVTRMADFPGWEKMTGDEIL